MGSTRSVRIELRTSESSLVGTLTISLLPNSRNDRDILFDLRGEPGPDSSLEPIQLMEGSEYRFVIDTATASQTVSIDRTDIFTLDESDGRAGRIRPGMHVGTLPIEISIAGDSTRIDLEVRSRKLDYLTHYRWMLRDIADAFVDAIMERFAATEQRFALDETADAKTLYQRFAFLKSLWKDESFISAFQHIVNRPYIAWKELAEPRLPSQGIRGSSRLIRQLSRPGPGAASVGAFGALPRYLTDIRSEETANNPPNQFVKWALGKWREDVSTVLKLLTRESDSAPVTRGKREAAALLAELDQYLASPVFRDVDHLAAIPSSNPTLLKKAGYREVARAFVQSEMAAALGWKGGEEVYGAGQRDVATLYEYWAFIQIAQCLSSLSQTPIDFGRLIETANNGLNLTLARGEKCALTTTVTRYGREIACELWFNLSFTNSTKKEGSWSRTMRPDCSLLLLPKGVARDDHRAIWVHFDAKYRAEELADVFGKTSDNDVIESGSDARREDLLKMHAYRDAIRRSAGAYVLYPGVAPDYCREYHELLPGLGAFALRPSVDGDPDGLSALRDFVDGVITHAASQLSQHERDRFWEAAAYAGSRFRTTRTAPFLRQPPADTNILLGFVRNDVHLQWIISRNMYNLRADDRTGRVELGGAELAASFVLLYGPSIRDSILTRVDGPPRILDQQDMVRNGYEQPGGRLYFCLPLSDLSNEWPTHLTFDDIRTIISAREPLSALGTPVVVTWDKIFGTSLGTYSSPHGTS